MCRHACDIRSVRRRAHPYIGAHYESLPLLLERSAGESDFLQSLLDHERERSSGFFAAQEHELRLVNRPFGGGDLFRRVRANLARLGAEFDCRHWPIFSEMVVAHPSALRDSGNEQSLHLENNI